MRQRDAMATGRHGDGTASHQIAVATDTLNDLWRLKAALFPGKPIGSISHDDVIRKLIDEPESLLSLTSTVSTP
jgi:hypothetical protein